MVASLFSFETCWHSSPVFYPPDREPNRARKASNVGSVRRQSVLTATRESVDSELLKRLVEARRVTDFLFDIVQPEALYDRPIGERHRIIFYVGHLEAFDWNLLRERMLNLEPFDAQLDRLFAFGIDPVDGGLPTHH